MLKEKLLPISIICLSISIILAAITVSNGMKNCGLYVGNGLSDIKQGLDSNGNLDKNTSSVVFVRSTYDLPTASDYLGIKEDELISIIDKKDSGIPYIKIDNKYIFNKGALDKWLETAKVEIK